MSPGERAGEADPEAGMGQFLEPQLARDPQKKLVVRRQVRRAFPAVFCRSCRCACLCV